MNRGQLRAALTSRLGIPPAGDGLLDPNTLNDLIGVALRDISVESDWPWLLTSAPLTFNGDTATAPTDMVKARELKLNNRRARYAPLSEFLDAQAQRVTYVWTTIGVDIVLSPTPGTTPTDPFLYYIQSEPEMSSDTASPLLPDTYHQVLLARSAYHANTRRNRFEEAMRDDNEYQLLVRKMKDSAWARSGPRTIRAAGTANWATW